MSLPDFMYELTDAERSYDAGILAVHAFCGRTVMEDDDWLKQLECSDRNEFQRGVVDAQAGRCRILENNRDGKRVIRYAWKSKPMPTQ